MSKNYRGEEKLLLQIKEGNDQFLHSIYQLYWKPFSVFIHKKFQLPESELLDIYSKSFTIFYFNIKDGKLEAPLKSELQTYLFSIGINLTLKSLDNKKKAKLDLDQEVQSYQLNSTAKVLDYYNLEHQKTLVKELLDQLDEFCKELITMSYIHEWQTEVIAGKLNLPSNGAVRFRKHNCLKKLKNLAKTIKYV